MIETKLLKVLLMECLKSNSNSLQKSHPILGCAQIENGVLEMCGLGDCHLTVKTDTNLTGFLDVKMFNKTGSIAHSMSSGTYSDEDYPSSLWPDATKEGTLFSLDPTLFSVNFQQIAKYASDDPTRAMLQGIYFNPALWEVTATNGHVLIAKKLEAPIPTPFIVAPHAFKILDILSPLIESAEVLAGVVDRRDDETRLYDYLRVSGDGFSFVSKCMEGPYPDYNNVIPKPHSDLSVTLSAEAVNKLIAAVNVLIPFTNPKTHLVVLNKSDIFAVRGDLGKHVRVNIGEALVSENIKHKPIGEAPVLAEYIAFNAEYFLQFLKDSVTGQPITISYSPTDIGAVTVQAEKQRTLIMPLRFIDRDSTDWDVTKISPEYIEVEPAKSPVPKKQVSKLDKAIEKLVLDLQKRIGKKQLKEALEML